VVVLRIQCFSFDGDADSMLQFLFEKRGDVMKHCQKMKCRQRARLNSMGRKCDTVRRRDDIGRRRGGIGETKERKRR
jgi:hypothetical protein